MSALPLESVAESPAVPLRVVGGLGEAPSHEWAFRARRFLNWFVLGTTYATFYMGRYNLNVVKDTLEKGFFHGSQTEFGIIGLCGFWTYALSELVNGPIADRIGGRKAILLGAVGAAVFNFALGVLFLGGFTAHLLLFMSLLYAGNMFFQSFGAMSVVKVNAPWFHVRERGVFGGVFGIMISSGYTLAFGVSGWVLKHPALLSWYWVFLLPGFAISAMLLISALTVRDRPSHTGHRDFATSDASDGDETPVTFRWLFRRVMSNPVMLTLVAAEFCTGFVRQSLLFFFPKWLMSVHQVAPGSGPFWYASTGITIGGICGGLIAGTMSDRFFRSRRAPVAFVFYLLQAVSILALGLVHSQMAACVMIGVCCAWIFGVHGMLSGTASMDFGGRKGAATAAGMLDGIQYVASGITSVAMGVVIDRWGWDAWAVTIIPFSLVGAAIIAKLWNEAPKPQRSQAIEARAQ